MMYWWQKKHFSMGGIPALGERSTPGWQNRAGDLLHPCMDPVAEEDGLLGADIPLRIGIIKVSHGGKEEARTPNHTMPRLASILRSSIGFLKTRAFKASPSLRGAFMASRKRDRRPARGVLS